MKIVMNTGPSLSSEIDLSANKGAEKGKGKGKGSVHFSALRAALTRDRENGLDDLHSLDDGNADGGEDAELAEFLRLPVPASREPVDVLEWLDGRLHDAAAVTRGWRPVALRLRQQLMELDPARRMATAASGISRRQLIPFTAADPAVKGMLRKANRQVVDRCRACGAPPARASNVIVEGYCARHAAPFFLRRLIDSVNAPGWQGGKPAKNTPARTRLALDSGHLPAAIARVWLAEDREPGLEAIRAALGSGVASIPIDPFDRPRLAAWLMSRREAVLRACAQVAIEESPAPRFAV